VAVHVVDRDDFTYELSPTWFLHARPCPIEGGRKRLAMALQSANLEMKRLRIGCIHGSTFDIGWVSDELPDLPEMPRQRGFDYLAI